MDWRAQARNDLKTKSQRVPEPVVVSHAPGVDPGHGIVARELNDHAVDIGLGADRLEEHTDLGPRAGAGQRVRPGAGLARERDDVREAEVQT